MIILKTVLGDKPATPTHLDNGQVTITSNDNRFRLTIPVETYDKYYPVFETRQGMKNNANT